MIPFIPFVSVVLATLEDSVMARVERKLQIPTEIEDLLFTGFLDEQALEIAMEFAELGISEIFREEQIDILRCHIDAVGGNDAEIITGQKALVAFYGAILGPWLIRVEPWCWQCIDQGYEQGMQADPPAFPDTPEDFRSRLSAYKSEAAYRRANLSSFSIDGPPKGYKSLVLELWTTPSPEDQREHGFEALSIEIWRETPSGEATRPQVRRRRR